MNYSDNAGLVHKCSRVAHEQISAQSRDGADARASLLAYEEGKSRTQRVAFVRRLAIFSAAHNCTSVSPYRPAFLWPRSLDGDPCRPPHREHVYGLQSTRSRPS